jgi:hypothetical protein
MATLEILLLLLGFQELVLFFLGYKYSRHIRFV